ncbi:uncharacterized protein [Rutidosis leptorrhynchoides]|uniref:uncharacterized protein n=1 Tax=Rutidosis leptorrhynchoides TaxID=125765 RepID=UPI003A98E196
MSSMMQADKKRRPTNNQTKRPSARVETTETKLQREKSNTTPRAKEGNKKPLSARENSNIAVNNRIKNSKPTKVQEKLSRYRDDKPSIRLDPEVIEPNDVRDESDSDTVTDSVSTSGDSRANEDEKLENASITSLTSTKNDSSDHGLNHIQNSKSLKVHPKPPSIHSSISSDGFDGLDHIDHKETVFLDAASNGVQSDDEAVDENIQDEVKKDLELKIAQMQMRIGELEDELRDVAALEISLYSAVQEHGSVDMMHKSANRLSKLYFHASKHLSVTKRATVAGNVVSGLVMISKSCGNDVSRLTFWLSNVIVLREIITQTSGYKQYDELKSTAYVDDHQETRIFTSELQKIESEIFSQIVESIWRQNLMPNMLKNEKTFKLLGPISSDRRQCDFSINLWLNAIQDAFNRLCPARAAGHECGCIPVMSKMVMEQCAARLDVAMFNCILRKSAHETRTDSASDPITESRVLPIPADDLSFGSGAQLKKAVGNLSKFLTDKFSVNNNGDPANEQKWFSHLNSLSHLLMVPKDMLMDRSIRAEICPSISLSLLNQILDNFTPDEFCPDPVPDTVLEAINAEFLNESRLSKESSSTFPYAAAGIIYKPPSSIDISDKVSEAHKNFGSNRTSHIEEISSFRTFLSKKLAVVNGNTARNARYELLGEVWSS